MDTTIKRAKRKKMTPRFTSYQIKVINSLVDKIGNSPSDVISKIVVMWLYEKNYLK